MKEATNPMPKFGYNVNSTSTSSPKHEPQSEIHLDLFSFRAFVQNLEADEIGELTRQLMSAAKSKRPSRLQRIVLKALTVDVSKSEGASDAA
jgi:hypothetical protein